MSKRDQILKGGLNTILGGLNSPKTDTPSPVEAASQPQEEVIEEATPEEEDELINTIEDEELRAALLERRNRKRGRPRKGVEIRQRESDLYTRTTLIISKELLSKLKEICFLETLTLKEIIEGVLGDAVKTYEEKHGEVIPKVHKGDASSVFKK